MIRLLVYLLLAAALAALADLVGRRLAAKGECTLHKALMLKDSCQGRCPPGQRCVAFQTRAYWLGGTQAAGCGCIDRRFGGSALLPPDFAELPRRLGDPPGTEPVEPEREDAGSGLYASKLLQLPQAFRDPKDACHRMR